MFLNDVINKYRKWKVTREQGKIDEDYGVEGLTDEILNRQIKLNEYRNKYDISDDNQLDKEGWSQ